MTTELKTSIGTDDDSTKLVFQAKQIVSLVDASEGLIVRISSTEYGIVKNGILANLPVAEVPITFITAFAQAELLPNPPKYPYALIVKENSDVKSKTAI